jgi:hypothetical protein
VAGDRLVSAPAQLSFEAMALPPISRAKRMRHALIAADRGIDKSASSADTTVPGWTERAVERVRVFARAQAGFFTIEQCRWVLEQEMEQPPELRAWGSVTRMALGRGFIEKTSSRAPAYSSNGSEKPMYRRGSRA